MDLFRVICVICGSLIFAGTLDSSKLICRPERRVESSFRN